MKFPIITFLFVFLSFLASISIKAAVTLFEDDFSDLTSGTQNMNVRTPLVGSWTSVSGGAVITGNPAGGYLETQGGAKVLVANFTQSLGEGEVLRVTWTTKESAGLFSSGNAGVRLLLGDNSIVGFMGSTTALANFWELARSFDSSGSNTALTNVSLTDGNEAAVATLSYSYDTGMVWLTVRGGVGGADVRTATMNLGAGLAIDSLRLENGGSGDFRFSALKAVGAADGMWKTHGSGSWTDAANWSNAALPSSAGAMVDFGNLDLTSNATISLNGAQTVGHVVFGDLDIGTGATWTIQAGSGGTLVLDNSGSYPVLQVNNSASNITAQLVGTQGFTKTGVGSLSLNNVNNASTLSGQIVVNQGYLGISHDLALGAVPTIFNPSAILLNGGSLANMTNSTSGASTQYSSGHQVTIHENRGITLGPNGGTFRTGYLSSNMYISVNSVITGVGNLNKDDTANLILRNANTYTGNTNINAGNFYVYHTSGSVTGYGGLNLNGSSTNPTMLAGSGVLQGGTEKLSMSALTEKFALVIPMPERSSAVVLPLIREHKPLLLVMN